MHRRALLLTLAATPFFAATARADAPRIIPLDITRRQPRVRLSINGVDQGEAIFDTGAGAHHMVFFHDILGRELVAVQNNLLNLDGLNAGTITVHDIYTGERLRTLDMRSRYGLMPESVEWAYGHGHDYHH